MCLVALAIDQHQRFPLVIAANRDESFARPSAPLGWWTPKPGVPAVLSGRDLASGGTWMGLNAAGRLALVTNVRGVLPHDPQAPSRGALVTDWLAGDAAADAFWMCSALSGHNGFNLVAADFARGECFRASNAGGHPQRLERGVHGVSNGGFDAARQKVATLTQRLRVAIEAAGSSAELTSMLFTALADRSPAPDADLPRTGITLERERALSSAFVSLPESAYGTRCSTLIVTERFGRQRVTQVFERSFGADGAVTGMRRETLADWPPRARTWNQSDRDIAMCAIPASSNTAPSGVNPARA